MAITSKNLKSLRGAVIDFGEIQCSFFFDFEKNTVNKAGNFTVTQTPIGRDTHICDSFYTVISTGIYEYNSDHHFPSLELLTTRGLALVYFDCSTNARMPFEIVLAAPKLFFNRETTIEP